MTDKTDAQIAREWAEGFIKHADSAQIVDGDALTAARHILDTTAPPTMADVDWDDEVHSGRYAEHPEYGVVLMLVESVVGDIEILCVDEGRLCSWWAHPKNLTPLPGARLDLTPRRGPVNMDESSDGSFDGPGTINDDRNEGAMTINDDALPRPEDVPCDEVPEPTPDHPTELITEEDYKNAPAGTIVAGDHADPWVKDYMGFWLACSADESETSQEMALAARRVLRRGETL